MKAKPGFTKLNVPKLIKINAESGWTLCIGSGTSLPIFPDWKTLVRKLYASDGTMSEREVSETFKRFSLEALIQAWINQKEDIEISIKKMSDILYSDLKEKCSKEEWRSTSKILSVDFSQGISNKDFQLFSDVIDKHFKITTAHKLSNHLRDIIDKNLSPSSIISFNGEALLLTLLNYEFSFKAKHNIKKFDTITGSLSKRNKSRIPYYFNHGILPPPFTGRSNLEKATDKLVFSELEYVNVATQMLSWQTTTFFNACQTSNIIFIGLSLSDPNIRRWLAAAQSSRLKEIQKFRKDSEESTYHYWIEKRPNSQKVMRAVENAVSHLGVRMVWLDDWNDFDLVFGKLY